MHQVQQQPIRPGRYESPVSIARVFELLAAKPKARIVAGGTDLMIELARHAGDEVDVLIDITRIPDLDRITVRDGRIRLGPLVTHNQCATSAAVVNGALPLAQACLEVGSPALRNRATVVGNLVTASPANDTLSALAVLGADLTVGSARGERTVAIEDFQIGVRRTVLEPDEMVVAVSVAEMEETARGSFVKLGLRRAQAISVVHMAALCTFDGELVSDARIAVGSVAPTIVRVPEAETLLVGTALDRRSIDVAADLASRSVTPIDDIRSTAEYRSEMVAVMLRRALSEIAAGQERTAYPVSVPTLGGPNVIADDSGASLGPGDSISTTINRAPVEAAWTATSLLDWIRNQAGLTGTKEGCAEGECGACTVHLDGVATLSCLIPAGRAHGASLTTIEGLTREGRLHPLQRTFVDGTAVQCGYCTPGFVMAGASLLAERSSPTPDEVKLGLSGNLCRCTGYYGIETAVTAAGRS